MGLMSIHIEAHDHLFNGKDLARKLSIFDVQGVRVNSGDPGVISEVSGLLTSTGWWH